MSHAPFPKGTKVHVEFDGTVVGTADALWVTVQDNRGIAHKIWHASDYPAPMTAKESAHWPPQPGDVWKLPDGTVLAVRVYHGGSGTWSTVPMNTPKQSGYYFTDSKHANSLQELKDSHPVLLYREGVKL